MFELETELVHVESLDQHHAASTPLYQSATFHQPSVDQPGKFDYTRSGNPTRWSLEAQLTKIMVGADHAYAVASGMSAFDVITRLLHPGDEVVAGLDLYGGSSRLLTYLQENAGIIVHNCDTTNVDDVARKMTAKTRIVLIESPTNPGMQVCDVRAIAKLVHSEYEYALLVVDNTMMSPLNMNPFELGADIWYESATKYLCGHHDLMGGVVAAKSPDLSKKLGFIVNMGGSALAPFDSWLLLRGLKTLGVRFDRQQDNAIAVANWLEALKPHLKLDNFEVKYPGLKSDPGYELHAAQAKGPGGVLSIRTFDVAISQKIVDSTKVFGISVSFGAVNSLISLPCKMSHASIRPEIRAARGFPEDIIRLCIGIESSKDLIEDLRGAFVAAGILDASLEDVVPRYE